MADLESWIAIYVMALAAELCERHAHQCSWWYLGAVTHRQLYYFYICPAPPPLADAPSADELRWN